MGDALCYRGVQASRFVVMMDARWKSIVKTSDLEPAVVSVVQKTRNLSDVMSKFEADSESDFY